MELPTWNLFWRMPGQMTTTQSDGMISFHVTQSVQITQWDWCDDIYPLELGELQYQISVHTLQHVATIQIHVFL